MPSVSVNAPAARPGLAPVAKPASGPLERHASESSLPADASRSRGFALAEAAAGLPANAELRQTVGLNQLGAWAAATLPADDERRVGLERLHALLDRETAAWTAAADAARDRAAGLQATLRLHESLLAGERLPAALLSALVGELRRAHAVQAGPALDLRPGPDRTEDFARHALNHARLALFLSGGAATNDVLAAALLMDAPLLARAATGQAPDAKDRAKHAASAAGMLERAGFPAEAVAAVRDHHERLDGAGPRKAVAANLSPLARRFGVAAAFLEAVQEGHDLRAALQRTLRLADAGGLDADEALRLLEIGFHPVGTVVELATGEAAEVVATHRLDGNAELAALPIVRVLRGADGVELPGVVVWNLAQRPASRVLRAAPPRQHAAPASA